MNTNSNTRRSLFRIWRLASDSHGYPGTRGTDSDSDTNSNNTRGTVYPGSRKIATFRVLAKLLRRYQKNSSAPSGPPNK
eukprot:850102-Rhodomonas_salina.1